MKSPRSQERGETCPTSESRPLPEIFSARKSPDLRKPSASGNLLRAEVPRPPKAVRFRKSSPRGRPRPPETFKRSLNFYSACPCGAACSVVIAPLRPRLPCPAESPAPPDLFRCRRRCSLLDLSPRARTLQNPSCPYKMAAIFFPARTDAPQNALSMASSDRRFPTHADPPPLCGLRLCALRPVPRSHGRPLSNLPPSPTVWPVPCARRCPPILCLWATPARGRFPPRPSYTADSARSSFPGHAGSASLFSLPRHRPYQPLRKSFRRLFPVLDQNILLVEPILISYNNY